MNKIKRHTGIWQYIFLLLLLCGISLTLSANLFQRNSHFLPAQQAFAFSISEQKGQALQLHWDIAEGYYLYQKEIEIIAENAEIGQIQLPEGKKYQDEFFGEVVIYQDQLNLNVPILSYQKQGKLLVHYQGCTTGFCYPPETQEVDLALWYKQSAVQNDNIFSQSLSSQQLANQLSSSKYAMLGFFLLGIGLAFTPCVLPMLPLLSAIVIGQQRPSQWRAFALSFVYVQGMALTYTLLGLIVVTLGLPFQIALQSPYVLIGFSILFILLALSMFGLFNLQLPQRWQTKLVQFSQRQQSGAFAGVFIMGMVAGLIASPCTTAPLSGALLYVAQSGDMFTGAITLYLLALGMGIPLLLITLFGNKLLPKSGAWLEKVKIAFGFVLLALPIFLFSRIQPDWSLRLWALLGTTFFLWLASQMKSQGIGQGLRLLFLIFALVLVKPLQDWLWQPSSPYSLSQPQYHLFEPVKNLAQLEQYLTDNQKPLVMLDLYADWCVACKEFEKYTFSDPNVQQTLSNMLLLQVDMTQNSAENKAIIDKFKVLGLPTILFFDHNGKEIESLRITGFMNAEAFLRHLAEK
ncbi:protein-disulfide reductase DsbD [Volucribacter amazonae]|uniref:Thiol:disulfide interchange protein DsbD n=1 Tax=Volucribacter amazonae TaxID=256731 RepID=A0A9X4P7K8_9PAST|nr:protein-disulfide reductase DsbD [Volucribacter amazonae]MDG6894110.1 protein-disulfide reductase DsbD [Volucribacter amazonae]